MDWIDTSFFTHHDHLLFLTHFAAYSIKLHTGVCASPQHSSRPHRLVHQPGNYADQVIDPLSSPWGFSLHSLFQPGACVEASIVLATTKFCVDTSFLAKDFPIPLAAYRFPTVVYPGGRSGGHTHWAPAQQVDFGLDPDSPLLASFLFNGDFGFA